MTDQPQDREPRDVAMDRLVQQNRILQEARMLPHNRELRPDEVEAVRHRVRALIEDSIGDAKITGATIAKDVGISRSTFSAWLNGTYPGNVDKITRHVNEWTERHSRRQRKRARHEFIWTWAVDQMKTVIELARDSESMIAVVAPSGSGKDMVIDYLATIWNGVVVNCHTKMTAKEFLIELADQVGLSNKQGTAAALIRRIVKELRDKTCVVFLNEAQQLPNQCASIIRTIHDQTHVPVAMLGSFEIFEFVDDRNSGGGQFSRRCMRYNLLDYVESAEDPDRPGKLGRKLFSKEEVAQFIESKKLRLAADDAFEMLHRLANLTEHGTLGLVNAVLECIIKMYPGERVTARSIVEAIALQLGAEARLVLYEVCPADDTPAVAAATA